MKRLVAIVSNNSIFSPFDFWFLINSQSLFKFSGPEIGKLDGENLFFRSFNLINVGINLSSPESLSQNGVSTLK